MRGIEIKSKRTGVPGWHSEAEEDALVGLVHSLSFPPNEQVTIVELGGEYGRSASEFAYALREKTYNGHVYTVDTFTDTHPIVGNLLDAYTENLKECGLVQYVTPIQGSTAMQAHNWQRPIGLLFIDAGHTYTAVKSDIAAWSKYVKPNGLMVFHDYAKTKEAHTTHLDVKRAVDEWYSQNQSNWERHNGPDSLVWFVKNSHVQHEDSSHEKEHVLKSIDLRPTQPIERRELTLGQILPPESEIGVTVYQDYTKLSYKELRKLASVRDIDAKKKNDIIEALQAQDKED